MKTIRKIIQIDEDLCDGCGQCVPSCAEGALEIVDGKARMVAEKYCDGLGACLGECPKGALRIIEREADDFDETAVEERLTKLEDAPEESPALACGCPSSQIRVLHPTAANDISASDAPATSSQLGHWPVKIKLVSAQAPFLKHANLLVLADCGAIACTDLHRDFLKNRVVMAGCPKFDDVQAYIDKFTEIFKTAAIKSITVLTMEVPCCAGLPYIVKKALENAGVEIPLREVVIDAKGQILPRR